MSLIKDVPPALKEMIHSSVCQDSDIEKCYSVGRGGIAGRLFGHLLSSGETIDSHDYGVKVTVNRITRQMIYFESSTPLPLTACYQLYLQPVGMLEGYLRQDKISVNKKHPNNGSYMFITDQWLTSHQLRTIALV
ncbi:hypothetical protein ACQKPX_00175 [Photobacterium sp. DNB23_23_1]|uniref:Uncharacterized protein n=1 Tax=Photobacterium pectinilyticum TaxID=2906793 RepID=A0ABT1N2X8_9GAMM|nr:hypothetical protein [Photobacterium sp. ZSDE20]MCQ1057609.1 hypothetical protein [Photobacterium sp. ZSDE20]MDD1821986.1 hypothetical protein [Photobacterium sp. ZSDE20]